jgi:methyl-accepting chemotaxis protein
MNKAILDELTRFLNEMEGDLSCCNEEELRKQGITSRIIKGTLALMLVLFVANSYSLYLLSTGLSESLEMVDSMAVRFGQVTGSLSRVTDSVSSIDVQLATLDRIDADMAEVSSEVSNISNALLGINSTVTGLSGEMQVVDRSMGVINSQVYNMSGNVQQMGGNVHKISKPMGIMNKMVPW